MNWSVLAAAGTGLGAGDQHVDVRFSAIAHVVHERHLAAKVVLITGLTIEEERDLAGRPDRGRLTRR